jgi:hypothetical protein
LRYFYAAMFARQRYTFYLNFTPKTLPAKHTNNYPIFETDGQQTDITDGQQTDKMCTKKNAKKHIFCTAEAF